MQTMMEVKNVFVDFMREEEGTSTIEYVIGAAVVALFAVGAFTKLKDKIFGAADATGEAIDSAIDMASE